MELEVWYSSLTECWRIDDRILFSYYDVPSVVNHFAHHDDQPTRASLVGKLTRQHAELRQALRDARIEYDDWTEDTQAI